MLVIVGCDGEPIPLDVSGAHLLIDGAEATEIVPLDIPNQILNYATFLELLESSTEIFGDNFAGYGR